MQLPWHEGELSEGRWPAPEQGKAIDLVSLTNRTAELALLKMPIADATTVALKLDEWVCAFARQACCVRAEDEGLRALNRCFLVIHWWQLVAHLAVARERIRVVAGYLRRGRSTGWGQKIVRPSAHELAMERATKHTSGLLHQLGFSLSLSDKDFDPANEFRRPNGAMSGTEIPQINQEVQDFLLDQEPALNSLYREDAGWKPEPKEAFAPGILEEARAASDGSVLSVTFSRSGGEVQQTFRGGPDFRLGQPRT